MEGYDLINAGLLSILPPLIAIILALITKEVYSALLVGVVSGLIIYGASSGIGVVEGVLLTPQLMAEQIGGNGSMILFLSLLGALVAVVTKAGGSRAYGNWAAKKISSAKGAKVFTGLLGVLIFIDDYFNCLTVGTVMQPVTDKFRISREKLAYLIDATAAPVCIISPISSWAVAVAGYLSAEDGFNAFVASIPYNLYALLTLFMVLIICVTNFDFGPMKKAEDEAKLHEPEAIVVPDESGKTNISSRGTVLDLVVPILTLIVLSILGMAYAGGFFSGVDFITAIGENPTAGLCLGAFGSLLIAAAMYLPRKLMPFRDFMSACAEGVKTMVPAIMILTFAWSLSSVCRYMLGTGEYVSALVETTGVSLSILPAFVFAVAAFLSFSMGTAWGTFGILLPIVVSICSAEGGAAMLAASMGATLAGSVFGDHCSPISDTTILASTGAHCNHLSHVSTQMPYAIFVALICFVGYLLSGLILNPWIVLVCCMVIMVVAMYFINKIFNKKAAE